MNKPYSSLKDDIFATGMMILTLMFNDKFYEQSN